jgi:hypothetical protein
MSSTLVNALHHEERSIIAELRASKPFQRLEGIHKLLALYDAQPSAVLSFGAAEPERAASSVIQLAPVGSAPLPTGVPIPMPGPVAATAEAAVAEVARASAPAPAVAMADDGGSVVSSVRAALLGIGKS